MILKLRAIRERRVTPAPVPELPALSSADRGRIAVLYQFVRLQLPTIRIPEPKFLAHLERSFRLFQSKTPRPVSWAEFLEGLYAIDWAVCVGCIEGLNPAWETLFAARTGRSDQHCYILL